MRTTATKARWSAVIAVTALLVAGIAGTTLASDNGAEASDRGAGSTVPGDQGSGNSGDGGSVVIVDPPVGDGPAGGGDCGSTQPGPGTEPDTPVSFTPCVDDGSVVHDVGDDEPIVVDPDGAQPVTPTPGMADVRSRPFDDAVLNSDGTVTILFWSGIEPCYVLDHVDVRYGTDTVTITLFEGHDPSAGDVACIEIGVFKSVTLTLDEPLDGRTIVDGAA